MIQKNVIGNYHVVETLFESEQSLILRAVTEDQKTKVVLKTIPLITPSHRMLSRFNHELHVLRLLSHSPYVVRTLGLEHCDQRPVLVFQDEGHIPLPLIVGQQLEVEFFLEVGIHLASALASIHQCKVTHKDLKPAHILYNAETNSIRIIDFGIASVLPFEAQSGEPPAVVEGTLAYMSPEQTGRMNRGVDFRSDLYSLGVVFYELLAGHRPYEASDALGWCHCLMTMQPPPLHEIRPDLPEILSAIVMKLMAKAAEDRYQSAGGLRRDLEHVQEAWRAQRKVVPFTLGCHDELSVFRIPEKLYGRQREIEALLKSFTMVVAEGTCRLFMIAGAPGIGKSSLVQELFKPLTQARGAFLSGKFDQFACNTPYQTIVQAVQVLIRNILAQPEEVVAEWRRRILEATGKNGRVITEVIPDLQLIIGEQPSIPALGPSESMNRFNMVFREFIRVLAPSEQPLAIFLDDMQWADAGTLQLLETILLDPRIQNIQFIFAYRDNEVRAAHPFMITIERLVEKGIPFDGITLPALSPISFRELIADTLRDDPADNQVKRLADLIYRKTGGNPFFTIQFILRMHRDGLLVPDPSLGRYHCDYQQVKQRRYTDNVVEHMVECLEQLADDSREMVKLAACIGTRFNIATLATAGQLPHKRVADALWPLLQENLIVPLGDGSSLVGYLDHEQGALSEFECRFQHDRIQLAAYSMLDEEARAQAHLRIGRAWRDELDAREIEEQIFNITTQMNSGASLIEEESEKLELAALNLRAGRKAKTTTAYASAVQYLAQAEALLPADAWERLYELSFSIARERAECEYLSGAHDVAKQRFATLNHQARTAVEKAELCIIRQRLYQVSGQYAAGVDLAVEALALFGITVPQDPAILAAEIDAGFQSVGKNMKARKIAELLDAPRIHDPAIQAIVDLAVGAMPCAYIGRPEYFPWFELLALNTSLQHGNTESSCFAYSAYGFLLISVLNEPRQAYEFSAMSLELNQRFADKTLRGTLLHLHGDHFNYWSKPIESSFPYLEEGFVTCQEAGDLVYSGFIAFEIVWQFIERGDPLTRVLERSEPYLSFAQQTNNEPVYQTIRMQQQFIAALQGRTRELFTLSDDEFDEQESLRLVTEASFGCGIAFFQIIKQILFYLGGDYAQSLAAAQRAAPIIGATSAMPMEANHYFYKALAQCALWSEVSEHEKGDLSRELEGVRQKFATWSLNCPENFRDRLLLLEAEIKGEGDLAGALENYEQAVLSARQSGHPLQEAVSSACAARFCQKRGWDIVAKAYYQHSKDSYGRWGAGAMEQRSIVSFAGGSTHTTTTRLSDLDFVTMAKATRAISSEIRQSSLVDRLLFIAMEHAGANGGGLLLYENGQAYIMVQGQSVQPLTPDAEAPRSALDYCARTAEVLWLRDVQADPIHRADPYLKNHDVRSLLCLPIVRQGTVLAVLYLENRLLPDAFTPQVRSALEVVAAQAAVSLENARFYDELEHRVEERTHQLRETQRELVDIARQAGMAEVASSVLHNVGNILNTMNVSAQTIYQLIGEARFPALERLATFIEQHLSHLTGSSDETDQRLLRLPEFISATAKHLEGIQSTMQSELNRLKKSINDVTMVIRKQQQYATDTPTLSTPCCLGDIVNDALQLCGPSFESHKIDVTVKLVSNERYKYERHRLLQLILSLLTNARDALITGNVEQKRVEIVIDQNEAETTLSIADNGEGIPAEKIDHIFNLGYSTRGDGRGFGLHSAATTAQSMGGQLLVASSGCSQGATFMLILPNRDAADPKR